MNSPALHYAEAERLMAKVADMHDPCLPIARALTAQAAVHAALATAPIQTATTHKFVTERI